MSPRNAATKMTIPSTERKSATDTMLRRNLSKRCRRPTTGREQNVNGPYTRRIAPPEHADAAGGRRTRRSLVPFLVLAVTGAGVLAFSFLYEGHRTTASTGAHLSVAVTVAVVVVAALVAGRGRQREPSRTWLAEARRAVSGRAHSDPATTRAVVAWVVLIAALIGWDLVSFLAAAHDLPTLSREIGRVTQTVAGRAVVFAAWVALGTWLGLGGRARRRGAATGTPDPGEVR
jgi:hypothetical protein